jgi:hypothetical protein
MIPTSRYVRKPIVTVYRELEGTATAMIPTSRYVRKPIVTVYRKLEGTATAMVIPNIKKCKEANCDNLARVRGYCNSHDPNIKKCKEANCDKLSQAREAAAEDMTRCMKN